MTRIDPEVLCEGWLTKSPPIKRVWRARWRRRWFSLKKSIESSGQYNLIYYTNRSCRKLIGVIELTTCEKINLGLKLKEKKHSFEHVFDIKTPTRTYFLAADTEDEMRCWVKNISKACGLEANFEEQIVKKEGDEIGISAVNTSNNPYIPISECFTGNPPFGGNRDILQKVPVNVEKSIFTYNGSPKPFSSNLRQAFKYDSDEPASPHSQTSSKSGYSNLSSPLLLSEIQLMPPPRINRNLKPKGKFSSSHSIGSNSDLTSQRFLPSEESLSNSMHYLDLDLDKVTSSTINNSSNNLILKCVSDNYKEIDFIKTHAFNVTRNNLERERQDPVKIMY